MQFKYKYARVDALVDIEDNYLVKARFNSKETKQEAPMGLAEYLDQLGDDGWKMISAQTVGTAGDYRQEVYYFEQVIE